MTETATPAARRSVWRRVAARLDAYERLLRLDKPIGTLLLLWPTLSALWLATLGSPPAMLIIIFVTGTLLMRSAGCAVNDWADRGFDAHVARTSKRPLATGEVAPWEALALAAVLGFAAFLLVLGTNRTTVLLSIPGALIAVTYPFFKRFFAVPQAFLGIAFSFGIPMAYAAVQNEFALFPWVLAGIHVFWIVAYDTEYAMVDRADDVRIGIQTSALTFGRFDVLAVALCYAIFLAGMVWVGVRTGLGPLYWAGLSAAAACAVYHLYLIRSRDPSHCFRAFLHNNWLGFAIFAGIFADYAFRAGRWPRWL